MDLTLNRIKALAKRLADSEEIKQRKIVHPGKNTYLIPRSVLKKERVGEYRFAIVVRATKGWSCNCQDWFYNHPEHGGYCKHVLAILQIEEDPKLMDNLEAKIKELY